jgi:hypothetical protein
MLFFNEINCRRIGMKETNAFANFFSNWYFIFVVVGTVAVQLVITTLFFENIFIQTRITQRQTMASIAWGATVLLIGPLLKMTPEAWVNYIPIKIDESKPPTDDALTNFYAK